MINIHASVAGEYRLVLNRPDGSVQDTGWFDNIILNQGLDYLGGSTLTNLRYAHVGTGTSTPAFTQTALDSFLAGGTSSPDSQALSVINEGAPLYRTLHTWQYVFPQGSVIGNITEVGVGRTITNGSLFSRARIVDNLGNPISITVGAIDQLTVFYRIRVVPPLADVTGVVNISSVNYNYTMRVGQVNNFLAFSLSLNTRQEFSVIQPGSCIVFGAGSNLGPITGQPTGSAVAGPSGITAAYTPGTYYTDSTLTFSISQGNAVGGIQCMQLVWGTFGNSVFQVRFDTPIPKTNATVLTLNVRYSWGRL